MAISIPLVAPLRFDNRHRTMRAPLHAKRPARCACQS